MRENKKNFKYGHFSHSKMCNRSQNITRETMNIATIAVFHICLDGNPSEVCVIDSKYIKMTGLQDFCLASSFKDPFRKQSPKVFRKKGGVLKKFANFTGKHLC